MQQPLPGLVQGGLGGGVAGLLLKTLAELSSPGSPRLIPCEPCLDLASSIDPRSFLIGLGRVPIVACS